MNHSTAEQRNAYLGSTPRPWLRLQFLDAFDTPLELMLVADTGCPHAVIIAQDLLDLLVRMPGRIVESNFGPLNGGWIRLAMPDFGFDHDILAFGNQQVTQAVRADLPTFQGLVGLPLLRLGEFGGNSSEFWFRRSISQP
jgi:hypothetical protein